MDILVATDNPQVEYLSSISQHSNKLHIMRGGESVPIVFDSLDYIGCDGIHSHLATITDKEDIGYNYAVDECVYLEDTYVVKDKHTIETEVLPEWYGDGTYQVARDEIDFVNADNGSLGVRNRIILRRGTNYAKAKITLKGE